MNKDCHYYGTYFMSRVAGFSHEDALDIAWAAETVDECSIHKMDSIRKGTREEFLKEEENFILTITDPTDGVDYVSFINELTESGKNKDALTAIRAIWGTLRKEGAPRRLLYLN